MYKDKRQIKLYQVTSRELTTTMLHTQMFSWVLTPSDLLRSTVLRSTIFEEHVNPRLPTFWQKSVKSSFRDSHRHVIKVSWWRQMESCVFGINGKRRLIKSYVFGINGKRKLEETHTYPRVLKSWESELYSKYLWRGL